MKQDEWTGWHSLLLFGSLLAAGLAAVFLMFVWQKLEEIFPWLVN